MKIDLHIHTKTCSDGNLSIEEVFKEAKKRNINFMSTTDHDCIDCQERESNRSCPRTWHSLHYRGRIECDIPVS
jgi:PHP family Zn ribbon phosphoesterase